MVEGSIKAKCAIDENASSSSALNTCIYRKSYSGIVSQMINEKHHISMPTNDTKYSCHRIDEGNEVMYHVHNTY